MKFFENSSRTIFAAASPKNDENQYLTWMFKLNISVDLWTKFGCWTLSFCLYPCTFLLWLEFIYYLLWCETRARSRQCLSNYSDHDDTWWKGRTKTIIRAVTNELELFYANKYKFLQIAECASARLYIHLNSYSKSIENEHESYSVAIIRRTNANK